MFWQHQILIAPYLKDLVLPDQLHGFASKELFEHCTAFEIVSSDGLIMKKLKQWTNMQRLYGFPKVLGIIDGTHINIARQKEMLLVILTEKADSPCNYK